MRGRIAAVTTYLSSRDSGAGGVVAPTASRTPSLDSEVSSYFTGPSGRSPFRRLSSPAPPLPFSTVRQSEISRSSPRSPLRRLRRSRSNRSIKYSLPGATQLSQVRSFSPSVQGDPCRFLPCTVWIPHPPSSPPCSRTRCPEPYSRPQFSSPPPRRLSPRRRLSSVVSCPARAGLQGMARPNAMGGRTVGTGSSCSSSNAPASIGHQWS